MVRRLCCNYDSCTACMAWQWLHDGRLHMVAFMHDLLGVKVSQVLRPGHRLGLGIVYEIAPFLMLLYVYFAWSIQSGRALPVTVSLAFAAVFWAGYEFWKYSRGFSQVIVDPMGAGAGASCGDRGVGWAILKQRASGCGISGCCLSWA